MHGISCQSGTHNQLVAVIANLSCSVIRLLVAGWSSVKINPVRALANKGRLERQESIRAAAAQSHRHRFHESQLTENLDQVSVNAFSHQELRRCSPL